MDFLVWFRVLSTVAGVVGVVVSYQLFSRARGDARSSFVTFQLQPERSVRLFEILFVFHVLALMALSVYVTGAFFDIVAVLNTGRGMLLVAGLPLLYVFYQWWDML